MLYAIITCCIHPLGILSKTLYLILALYRASLSLTLFDKAILKGNYIFILFITLITNVKDEIVIFTKLWESFWGGKKFLTA